MDLLVVRHAIAAEPEEFDGPDEDRPLTKEGRVKMARAADGLRTLISAVDVLVTSPLLRARQTADILGKAIAPGQVATTATLGPDREPIDFSNWLSEIGERRIAAVGHEPHLGRLVSWLLCGDATSRIQLKKGGACLLEIPSMPGPGSATLMWALRPTHLRQLAR